LLSKEKKKLSVLFANSIANASRIIGQKDYHEALGLFFLIIIIKKESGGVFPFCLLLCGHTLVYLRKIVFLRVNY
jgi:hypothetical protein